jgi:hypothetical protein
MRGREKPNLTWEKTVKRDLKNSSITKKLALNRSEWKLAIHVSEFWSSVPSPLLSFCQSFSSFYSPLLAFLLSVLLSFFLFWFSFYIILRFSLIFRPCFVSVFFSHVILSLTYPNLLGTKMFDCCCCYWWCCCCILQSKIR